MKRLKNDRMRLVVVGIVAVIVFGVGSVRADFTFGEPVNLGPTVNSSSGDAPDCISYDGLEMYFDSNRSGGHGGWDIWVSRRPSVDEEWGTPVNLGSPVNTGGSDTCAYISTDGLEMYFSSRNRPGGYGAWDIWVSKRPSADEEWGTPTNLGPIINGSDDEGSPFLSANGLELYFDSTRPSGHGSDDIWVSRRATRDDPWGEPINLGPIVNTSTSDGYAFLSCDGSILFFSGDPYEQLRPSGYGNSDMWMTRRSSTSDPWGTPVNLGPVINSSSSDVGPRVSPDGSMLYFCSERPGGYGGPYGDIYQAPIIPIIDFNGDGNVDALDLSIMLDHWGENYSLCDIGPMPWGDGMVDIEDLKIVAEHLFEDVHDPTLIAHWALDETEGMVVADSVGENDGYALGDPVWLHDGGQVNGALQLDGVDDYVVTGAATNPEGISYSVVAWIKGGAPGQVVLSQMGKADWLCANPSAGTLMTELTMGGRNGSSLGSEAIITDGNWHRIGFVWDGSYRRLYVDSVMVAEDTQDNLDISVNGLYIGTGKNMEPGTFFSGLIDDVRIYNRAVSP